MLRRQATILQGYQEVLEMLGMQQPGPITFITLRLAFAIWKQPIAER